MNAVLFGRIALLHENRANLNLTAQEMRLLERTYTRFHRAGAGLSDEAKKRMAVINERLAHLAQVSAIICSATNRTGCWSSPKPTAPGCLTASWRRRGPQPNSVGWPARRS